MPRGLIKAQFEARDYQTNAAVPLGKPVMCTEEEAELIASVLSSSGLDVVYDFVPEPAKRTQTKDEALQALHGLDDKWRKK